MNLLGLNIKRFSRMTFFLTTLLSAFLFVAVGLALSMVISAIFGPFDPADPTSPHPLGLIPFMALWYVYFIACIVKRLHDLNIHGAWTVGVVAGLFVPFIGLAVGLWLLFAEGTKGANDYGEQPQRSQIMGFSL